MPKPAPPAIDMEALVRRPKKAPEAGPNPDIDMDALLRRPARKPTPIDMETLIQRPRKAKVEAENNAYLESIGDIITADKMKALREATEALERDQVRRDMQAYQARKQAQRKSADPAPDMASLIQRKTPPARAADMADVVRRPQAPPAPAAPSKNTLRNEQVQRLIGRAREIEPALVEGMRFNTRLHRFLDLRPTAWTTWGEDDAREIVKAASAQAEASRQLSLANAVKWSTECEQAYSRPPGFFDRFAQNAKPEFYRVRLEQARDILTKAQDALQDVQTAVGEHLSRLRIDALVLQVATEHETDPSNQITATRRLQTLVQVQTTGAMILQGCETTAQTCAGQAATVSSLLTVTIPNWIMALQNR